MNRGKWRSERQEKEGRRIVNKRDEEGNKIKEGEERQGETGLESGVNKREQRAIEWR